MEWGFLSLKSYTFSMGTTVTIPDNCEMLGIPLSVQGQPNTGLIRNGFWRNNLAHSQVVFCTTWVNLAAKIHNLDNLARETSQLGTLFIQFSGKSGGFCPISQLGQLDKRKSQLGKLVWRNLSTWTTCLAKFISPTHFVKAR